MSAAGAEQAPEPGQDRKPPGATTLKERFSEARGVSVSGVFDFGLLRTRDNGHGDFGQGLGVFARNSSWDRVLRNWSRHGSYTSLLIMLGTGTLLQTRKRQSEGPQIYYAAGNSR